MLILEVAQCLQLVRVLLDVGMSSLIFLRIYHMLKESIHCPCVTWALGCTIKMGDEVVGGGGDERWVQGAATLGSEQMGKSFVLVKILAATGDGQAGAAEWRNREVLIRSSTCQPGQHNN